MVIKHHLLDFIVLLTFPLAVPCKTAFQFAHQEQVRYEEPANIKTTVPPVLLLGKYTTCYLISTCVVEARLR